VGGLLPPPSTPKTPPPPPLLYPPGLSSRTLKVTVPEDECRMAPIDPVLRHAYS
jgi:hypothetical protein